MYIMYIFLQLRRVIQEFGEQDDLLSEASSDGDSVNLSLLSGQDRYIMGLNFFFSSYTTSHLSNFVHIILQTG